jgi:hypothetical protein
MDLREQWSQISSEQIEDTKTSKEDIMHAIHAKSQAPLDKLRKKLYYKILWTDLGIIFFAIMFVLTDIFIVRALIGVIGVCYIVGLVFLVKEYLALREPITMDENLLQTLTRYYQKFTSILKYEERFGLFVYPISASAGFLIGASVDTPLQENLAKPVFTLILVLTVAVLVPVCNWLAKWMNRRSFGQYLEKLALNIKQLKDE